MSETSLLRQRTDGTVRVNLDDRTMDVILSELTERAGHARNTSALNLARWDLKAALLKYGYGYEPERGRSEFGVTEIPGEDYVRLSK